MKNYNNIYLMTSQIRLKMLRFHENSEKYRIYAALNRYIHCGNIVISQKNKTII